MRDEMHLCKVLFSFKLKKINVSGVGGAQPLSMQKNTKQFVHGLVLIPFFTTGSPFAILQVSKPVLQDNDLGGFALLYTDDNSEEERKIDKEHADKIDFYLKKRNMPLNGYGEKMVEEARKNDLDWRLLPALAIKESTGGKFACYNNPFGWGSCKIKFESWNDSIEVVARNLGGSNPKTERYYKDKTTKEKLSYYNSVIPTYYEEIDEFMKLIENGN